MITRDEDTIGTTTTTGNALLDMADMMTARIEGNQPADDVHIAVQKVHQAVANTEASNRPPPAALDD